MLVSECKAIKLVRLPKTKLDVYMLPIDMAGNADEVPTEWQDFIKDLMIQSDVTKGIGFLMVQERVLSKGQSHRRERVHIDGNYYLNLNNTNKAGHNPKPRPGHRIDKRPGGMLLVSNYEACKVWTGTTNGDAGDRGDCEHLRHEFTKLKTDTMKANVVYHTNASCIHESMPVDKDVTRMLVRLTLPAE